MRYITPPPPLSLGDASFGVAELIAWALRSQPAFNDQGYSGISSGARIDAVLRAHTSGVIALETEDWERLAEALRKPQGRYPLDPAYALVPLVRAVLEASETAPTEEPCESA